MVELVWVLPVFFALTAFIVWCSLELHARTALRSALFSGLRLAAARGNKNDIGETLIPDVEALYVSSIENERARQLLLSPAIDALVPPDGLLAKYYDMALTPVFQAAEFRTKSLRALPRQYTYSLVYIYAEIRSHLGGLAQFPCDPSAADGANCLRCQFLNPRPDRMGLRSFDDSIEPLDIPFLSVRCSYLPADPLSRAFASLAGIGASFWPLAQWEGITSISRYGYINEDGELDFQDLG